MLSTSFFCNTFSATLFLSQQTVMQHNELSMQQMSESIWPFLIKMRKSFWLIVKENLIYHFLPRTVA